MLEGQYASGLPGADLPRTANIQDDWNFDGRYGTA
jgi:hypothetical protein